MSHEFGLTTFSPSGKLIQVEYALNAVSNGNSALGIKAKNGVVIAAEKKSKSTLVVNDLNSKVEKLTNNCGITYAGIGPDFRVMTSRGRKEGQKYDMAYMEDIPVHFLAKRLAFVMQEYTHGVRPFGISLLVAGINNDGPQLYQVDPSGTHWGWKASAIGRNATKAVSFLEKRYQAEMELEDAIHTAILTLKDGFDGELDETKIEIGVAEVGHGFRVLTCEEVKDYLDEVV